MIVRLLLRFYPEPFRTRFGEEIIADFEAGAGNWIDLLRSILRERCASGTACLWPIALALIAAAPIGYLDLRSSEVQGIVMLILVGAGLFGVVWPRWAALWTLMFGLSVPLWHVCGHSSYPVSPNGSATLLALVPAVIAAYAGRALRHGFDANGRAGRV